MFDFLNHFTKSKGTTLAVFILINALIILGVNALFQVPVLKSLFENKISFIVFGAFIYILWLTFISAFLKKEGIAFADLSLTPTHLKQALAGAFLLFLLLNALFLYFAHNIGTGFTLSSEFANFQAITQSLGIFLFNIIPGAFIEELTFRALLLPQLYLMINPKINNSMISLVLAVLLSTLIFGICHIPRDLLRFDYGLAEIWNNSVYLFINSIIYSIIFLLCRNIWFTVFCHAFFNYSVVVIASESSSGFFTLVFGIILALLWKRMFPVKPLQ